MQSEQLLNALTEQTRQIMNRAEGLKNYDLNTLTWRANETSWSILECIEHLNLYGKHYLPEMERKIKSAACSNEMVFKSGFLGGYFAKIMVPKEKLNKMKTFKDKNPIHTKLDKAVLDTFVSQQIKLLDLLSQSRNVSLNRVRIPTSISGMIRLKLGDTYQFYINHMIRHFNQIDNIIMKATSASQSL